MASRTLNTLWCFLLLAIFFPISHLSAKSADSSEPLRFNNVEQWRGVIDMHASYNRSEGLKSRRDGCSSLIDKEDQYLHADLVLGYPPDGLKPQPGDEGPVALSRMGWGGYGIEDPSSKISGTIKQSMRAVFYQSCEDSVIRKATQGSDERSGSDKVNGILWIFGQELKQMMGGRYYDFSIRPPGPYRTETRGILKYLTQRIPVPVWKTKRIYETDTSYHFFESEVHPFWDMSTVNQDDVMIHGGENMVNMLENFKLPGAAGSTQIPGMEEMGNLEQMLAKARSHLQHSLAESKENSKNNKGPLSFGLVPVPASGMILSGKQNIKPDKEMRIQLSWTFVPDKNMEYELEVDIEKYDKWRPEGNRDASKHGNTLVIHAYMVDPRTKQRTATPAESIVFELRRTSQHPGTAMNHPVKRPDTKYDLRFEKDQNEDHFEITDEDQKIEDVFKKRAQETVGISESTVTLSSFDWGGRAELRVYARMPTGSGGTFELPGYLKDHREKSIINIPKRDDNSYIADSWKGDHHAVGKSDDADDETQPPGDGHEGDGLTLFEEYRGFYATPMQGSQPEHFDGNPENKDFFVASNAHGTDGGIKHFASLTKLAIMVMKSAEMRSDRVVNFNFSEGPHEVDQHGVIMEEDPDSQHRVHQAHGGPGTPGKIEKVTILRNVSIYSKKMGPDGEKHPTRDWAVAHELLHASSVWHHGEGDWPDDKVTWKVGLKDGNGALKLVLVENSPDNTGVFFGNYDPIQVYDEKGFLITGKVINQILHMRGAAMPIWMGLKHAQHSGQEDCTMRYHVADAYIPESYPSSTLEGEPRTKVEENMGWGICETGTGSGVNKAGRRPQPRYFAATSGRGNCKAQICVNDKYVDDGSHNRGAWF